MAERRDPLLLRLLYALGVVVAWFAYRVLRLRRDVIRGNLERSFPEWPKERLPAVEREFARRQGELVAELLYSPWLDEEEMRRRLVLVNTDAITEATPERPLIVITADRKSVV